MFNIQNTKKIGYYISDKVYCKKCHCILWWHSLYTVFVHPYVENISGYLAGQFSDTFVSKHLANFASDYLILRIS